MSAVAAAHGGFLLLLLLLFSLRDNTQTDGTRRSKEGRHRWSFSIEMSNSTWSPPSPSAVLSSSRSTVSCVLWWWWYKRESLLPFASSIQEEEEEKEEAKAFFTPALLRSIELMRDKILPSTWRRAPKLRLTTTTLVVVSKSLINVNGEKHVVGMVVARLWVILSLSVGAQFNFQLNWIEKKRSKVMGKLVAYWREACAFKGVVACPCCCRIGAFIY